MLSYIKIYLTTSLIYLFFLINYIHLRENSIWMHQANFFDYKINILKILLFYFISIPFVSYVFYKSINDIFSMLLSVLMVIGILPGVVIYSFSNDPSTPTYFIVFIYIPFFFIIINSFIYRFVTKSKNKYFMSNNIIVINLKLFKIIGVIGVFIYVYISIKYFNFLHISNFNEIYTQRLITKELMTTVEGYLVFFAKNLAAFSLLLVAIITRKFIYLFLVIFIYFVDYAFAANKSSIALILFTLLYYFKLSNLPLKYNLYKYILILILSVSSILNIALYLSPQSSLITGLYDRTFHTTAGLFSRFYEYCNEFYFFYGSTGLLGKLFDGVNNGIPATKEIGSYYFFEGVQSNANFIADGYLNFGLTGSFLQVFILWLLFSQKDNFVYRKSFIILLPFIFIFAKLLTSVGLQTALLSGEMILLVLMIKLGFRVQTRMQNEI